ncbi:hypothetical protein [Streptomyces plumbiresistens]|uniref:hypothetical protein n=1 Tax=Streptomyces plumbiresistens TaxID=511811 RepID=UPI0031F14F85
MPTASEPRVVRDPSGEVIRVPLTDALPRLSANCAHAPFQFYRKSPGGPGSAVTTAEVAALRPLVSAGGSWQGRARPAGADVPVPASSSYELRTPPCPGLLTTHQEGPWTERFPDAGRVTRHGSRTRLVVSGRGDAH